MRIMRALTKEDWLNLTPGDLVVYNGIGGPVYLLFLSTYIVKLGVLPLADRPAHVHWFQCPTAASRWYFQPNTFYWFKATE